MSSRIARAAMVVACSAPIAASQPAMGGEPSNNAPRPCAFAVDVSGSMQGEPKELLTAGLAGALGVLDDATLVSLAVFNHEVDVVSPLGPLDNVRRRVMVDAVATRQPAGGTNIVAAVDAAVNQLGDLAGNVWLVTDGAHTGNSSQPVQAAVWRPQAERVVARARQIGSRIDVLALGVAASSELPEFLAKETGGEVLRLEHAEALPSAMVGLAARLGHFWLCDAEAEFQLSTPETVVEFGPADRPSPLARRDNVSAEPFAAVFERRQHGLIARRLQLPAGSYRVAATPADQSPTYLLRPMRLRWELPQPTDVQAGRPTTFAGCAVASSPADDSELRGLHVTVKFRQRATTWEATATVDADGAFAVQSRVPAPGEFTIDWTAAQHGFRFSLGGTRGTARLPDPIDVRLRTIVSQPLHFATFAAEDEIAIDFEADAETFDQPLQLQCECSPPFVVEPAIVHLARDRTTFRLTVRRTSGASTFGAMIVPLRFRAVGDELVAPRVHAAAHESLHVAWVHHRPQLFLSIPQLETASASLTIPRGKSMSVPVVVRGEDVAALGSDVGVRLQLLDAPQGITAAWQTPKSHGPHDFLSHDAASAGVVIAVAGDVLPGRYGVRWSCASSDRRVPINGRAEPLIYAVQVDVPPVETTPEFARPEAAWIVTAPTEPARRSVRLLIQSETGALPPHLIQVECDSRITASEPTLIGGDAGRAEYALELSIPAQCAPFDGQVAFTVVGPAVVCRTPLRLNVGVVAGAPIVVETHATAVRRYPAKFQRLLGWRFPHQAAQISVVPAGNGSVAPPWTWAVRITRPNATANYLRPEAGQDFVSCPVDLDEAGMEYHLVVEPTYRHASHEADIPLAIAVHEQSLALADYLILISAALVAFVSVTAFAYLLLWPYRIAILTDDGRSITRWFRLSLHHGGFGDSTAYLRKGLWRGTTVVRDARGAADAMLQIESSGDSYVRVAPGDAVEIHRGDLLIFNSAAGSRQATLLNGRERSTVDEFDDPAAIGAAADADASH